MSISILKETHFLLHSFLLGVFMVVIYDVLRIFRGIIKHGMIGLFIEDFLYWVVNSVLIFIMLYQENNGSIRWFSIFGVAFGMILYNITVSRFLVKYIIWILRKILHFIGVIVKFISTPFAFTYKVSKTATLSVFDKFKLIVKFIIKRLKNKWRTIKMILCKR